MCNAHNHSASCNCGFGGGYRGYVPRSWRTRFTSFPLDWESGSSSSPTIAPITRSSDAETRLTQCPKCGQIVFFHRSENGGTVFFDELGPPWPKHKCFNHGDTRNPRHRYGSRYREVGNSAKSSTATSNGEADFEVQEISYGEVLRRTKPLSAKEVQRLQGGVVSGLVIETEMIELTLSDVPRLGPLSSVSVLEPREYFSVRMIGSALVRAIEFIVPSGGLSSKIRGSYIVAPVSIRYERGMKLLYAPRVKLKHAHNSDVKRCKECGAKLLLTGRVSKDRSVCPNCGLVRGHQ